jgi:hypothetical protein
MLRLTHSLLSLIAVAAAVTAQQAQIVLPDNHHLSESLTQVGNFGSTSWWRTTAGRFQVIYEASHFISAGITGPIQITKLRFRGEDGEHNLGGQVYTGVTVELGTTTLTTATYNTTTFATNRTPVAPDTTTMGTLGTTTVTIAPSAGTVPTNWTIDIDLAAIGAAITFDPTTAERNLLIDITMPTAPSNTAPLALVGIQDTTGGVAAVRGRGINTATPGSLTGTASTAPPVIGLEFAGTGGYGTIVPARNEFYGAACGGAPSTFYQAWVNGQPWDLNNGFRLVPDNVVAPNFYTVVAGAAAVDPTQIGSAALSTADDAVVTHPLGFTFNYPGGSTTSVKPSTNGFLWLDATMTLADFSPTVLEWLGNTAATPQTARFAPYWHDLNAGRNVALNPLAGLHAVTDTSGGAGNAVCYVTWLNVGEFNSVVQPGHANWTFQLVLSEATGAVEFRYGAMPTHVTSSGTTAGGPAALVGFTRGRIPAGNSVDPQSRDLSAEVPFSTSIEGANGNIGQVAVATPIAGGTQYGGRLFGGQSVTWNAVNVPTGALLGAQLIDIAGSSPGLFVPTVTAPGCVLSTTLSPILWETFFLPPNAVTGTVPFALAAGYNPGVLGFNLHAQFVLLDGLFNGGDLITAASNAIKHTVGLN